MGYTYYVHRKIAPDAIEHDSEASGQRKNHKYIMRVRSGNGYRYLYTQAEVRAYQNMQKAQQSYVESYKNAANSKKEADRARNLTGIDFEAQSPNRAAEKARRHAVQTTRHYAEVNAKGGLGTAIKNAAGKAFRDATGITAKRRSQEARKRTDAIYAKGSELYDKKQKDPSNSKVNAAYKRVSNESVYKGREAYNIQRKYEDSMVGHVDRASAAVKKALHSVTRKRKKR